MKKTRATLQQQKNLGHKIVMLTAYDYPMARLEDAAGVDVVLVGDSVGTNVLGYASEKQVTMDDMIHHLKAVRKGVTSAYVLADMPYQSYETPAQALANALKFHNEGADGVKIEGNIPDTVAYLVAHKIEVCAHLGFTPQSNSTPGLQAKTSHEALELIESARQLEQAGASMLVLELIPEEVAFEASLQLTIPTIGIGAGCLTDGQVLVVNDMLGINSINFRHNKKYEQFNERGLKAIQSYIEDVRQGHFPRAENTRHISEDALRELRVVLQRTQSLRA